MIGDSKGASGPVGESPVERQYRIRGELGLCLK